MIESAEGFKSGQGGMSDLHRQYVLLVVSSLLQLLGDELVSVAVFGSVARGEAGEGSDIDLIVVSTSFTGSMGERLCTFRQIEKRLMDCEERRALRREGFGTLISPIPLNPLEVKSNPPILLDLLTDGVILFDRERFLGDHLDQLRSKLRGMGARKIRLPSGSWYWDLKPDYRLGEVVEI